MKWEKLGRVYCPDGSLWWAKTHALYPTPFLLDNGVLRVYFSCLDENMYGRIGYLDCDPGDPTRILDIAREPVFDIGEPGTFDDCGVNPWSLIRFQGRLLMFYVAFQRTERTPYMIFTGLAESRDGGAHFERVLRAPVLERTSQEPILRSAACVLAEGQGLRIWYVSGVRWVQRGDQYHYNLVLRTATSEDALNWTVDDHVCLAPDFQDEYGLGGPFVVRDPDRYRMWFSVRRFSQPYGIGYAESQDGIVWTRKDHEVGLEPSTDDWDSEVEYTHVIDAGGERYLFYNGNTRGRNGYGVARLVQP